MCITIYEGENVKEGLHSQKGVNHSIEPSGGLSMVYMSTRAISPPPIKRNPIPCALARGDELKSLPNAVGLRSNIIAMELPSPPSTPIPNTVWHPGLVFGLILINRS